MSLNIKDSEAHELARAIAKATGESMTHVVTQALRERYAALEKARQKVSVDEILTLAGRVSRHAKGEYLEHGAFLYDDKGLPK